MVSNIGLVDSKDGGKWKNACSMCDSFPGLRTKVVRRLQELFFPFLKIRINYHSLWNERERLITT